MLQTISTNPEVVQHAPGRTPLMLIHDGGGTTFAYHALRSLDRTVIGIHSPGLLEGKGIVDVLDAAHQYAGMARQYLQQNGLSHSKILVGGWSLGGTISLAVAALYPDLVCGVVTIDTSPPEVSGMSADQAVSVLLHPWSRTDGIHGLVRKQLELNTRALLSNPEYQTTLRNVKVPVFVLCAMEPFQPPESLQKSLQLPESATAWLTGSKRSEIAKAAWKALLGEYFVGVDLLVGNHWTLFAPANTTTTTQGLLNGLNAIESWLSKRD